MQYLKGIKNRLPALLRDQRGITGLETAIILIAFVVVASVFAFTVLSTGIFSSERGKETVYAGLKEAQSSIEMKGSVVANGVSSKTISLAESAWTAQTNVTATAEATDKKEGSYSAKLSIADAFTTGLAAYEVLDQALDLSSLDSIQLWVKSSVATSSGDIELAIYNNNGCTGTAVENVDLPALVANSWKFATVALSNNSSMTSVQCVGLNVASDNGTQTVYLDEIKARGQATSVILTVTNAIEGEPIDLTAPSDSDNNGIADSDSRNTLIINYTDENQAISDIYWTASFIGKDDGDNLLEDGEKAEITVSLKGLSNTYPLVAGKEFTLEVKPSDGTVLVVEKTMPDQIDTVMNLN